MAKKIKKMLKVIIAGGKAVPAPPLGPTISAAGVNIKEFCDKFNEATRDRMGIKIPAILTVFEDRTFSLEFRPPTASALIKKKLGIEKGSSRPNLQKVSEMTKAQLKEVAEEKMVDLNAVDVEMAMNIIAGTAKQMGVKIID
jgi:large subunit ribosomal protein L11